MNSQLTDVERGEHIDSPLPSWERGRGRGASFLPIRLSPR